jgi:hypothetical protein
MYLDIRKKKTLAAITFTLLLATTFLLTSIPATIAQQTYTNMQEGGSMPLPAGVTPDLTLETSPRLSFRPNPVGFGQKILVNAWIQPPVHDSRYLKDYTITFTRPNGTTVVKKVNSYRADATSWFEYTPDTIGNWTVKFDFLGGYYPPGNYTTYAGAWFGARVTNFPTSCYYAPSSTDSMQLVVQQAPVASWPTSPLPTDYWTRPVSPNNREWWPILGNYPATGFVGGGEYWPADTNKYGNNYFTPYVQAPNTAHIVWKRQVAMAGVYGPGFPFESYAGGAYGASGTPSIIYQGRCYGTTSRMVNGVSTTYWQCYDLRTGQLYWEQTGVTAIPSFIMYEKGAGEVPGAEESFGQNVYLATISGGRLLKYDPFTGAISKNTSISPLSSGTFYADPYFLTLTGKRLINWTVQPKAGGSGSISYGVVIANNITYPFSTVGTVDYETMIAVTTTSITNPASGSGTGAPTIDVRLMAASLITGQLLWNVSSGVGYGLFPAQIADHGKFAARFNDGYWHCYDLQTGEHLWKSELSSFPWGTFGCYGQQSYGGMILSNQYDGVAAINWTDGSLVWFYKAEAPYPYETVYQGNYPFFTGTSTIADGKLYTYNMEHTPTQPLTRGWKLHCINITSGEGIWSIDGPMATGAVADGYLTASNAYDGYMYVFGKGKSATTVQAPLTAIPKGQKFLVTGTVLDQSPGQPGTPCASAESMSAMMEYIHMQKPIPANFTGVPVHVTALDPNGNTQDLGTVYSGINGNFMVDWAPPVAGVYKITASFAGDDSYGSSSAATGIVAVEATSPSAQPTSTPSPTATPTPTASPTASPSPFIGPEAPNNTALYVGIAAVVIIVVIAAVAVILRRRK